MQGRRGGIPLSCGNGRCGWLPSRRRIMIRSGRRRSREVHRRTRRSGHRRWVALGGGSSRSARCCLIRAPRSPAPTITPATGRPVARRCAMSSSKTRSAGMHQDNYGVYGARKVWLVLNREGIPVARCTGGAADARAGITGHSPGRGQRTRSVIRPRRARRIWSSASSPPAARMRRGWRIFT
jgi:hypothetical protein